MTNEKAKGNFVNRAKGTVYSLVALFLVLFFGLGLSEETSEYVTEGMRLAVECVIPSSFTFMIISDLYLFIGRPENLGLIKVTFGSLLGIPSSCISAFICGNLGGFPIGAKMISDIYSLGGVSKDDAERLIPLCNNPSCAFVVGGVGLGIYRDLRVGFLLLVSLWISTALCGIITRRNANKFEFTEYKNRQNYNFVSSVKSAGLSCVSLISFITVFSVIGGIIKKRVKFAPISYLISSFLEVTNAVKGFSSIYPISPLLALSLSAFSLGFGGISVAMQSSIFTSGCGIGMRKYYLIKLLEGVLCSAVFSILYLIIKRTVRL